jgi:hypothetical protein
MSSYFLSASIPDPQRDQRYIGTADIVAIRESVVALAYTVLRRDVLVFGGHPAISPLILLVAQSTNALMRIKIYQSEFFRSVAPRESLSFPNLVWTPAAGNARDPSLEIMRTTMIASEQFAAAFFIGGMEGVEEEFALFRSRWQGRPAIPIPSTGAAASLLFREHRATLTTWLGSNWLQRLNDDVVYRPMFEDLLLLTS